MMQYSETDFIYYTLGPNIIPADTIRKVPSVSEWTKLQTEELEEIAYLTNKTSGKYENGIAIICGKIWRGEYKGKWLNGIDLDNELAIKEFCTNSSSTVSIEEFKKNNLCEEHEDDPHSLHIYIITDEPIKSKALEKNFDRTTKPAIEIKSGGDKLMYSYPSMHGNFDNPNNPIIRQWVFNELKLPTYSTKEGLEKHIDNICEKYKLDYLKNRSIREKLAEKNVIPEGTRHNSLLTECNNLVWENIAAYRAGKITDEQLYEKFLKIAANCQPPHDDADIQRIFEDSIQYVSEEIENEPARYLKAKKEFKEQERENAKQEAENKENEEYERIKTLSKTISSFEAWQKGLVERYNLLYNTVTELMPNIWPSLEFELSIRSLLHIKNITLPFAGIVLGRPSSSKTIGIELFRKTRSVFYTDNFSPKSFVSHSSTVDAEKLKEVDLLPKLVNKCFLTPELAPLFAAKEDDLLSTFSVLTRILDGHGYTSDSGVHGHRGYDDKMMFTWIGAVATISFNVHKVMTSLGPRLYFFRNPEFYNGVTNARNEILEDDFELRVGTIQKILFDYLDWFEACPTMEPDDRFKSKLGKIPWSKEPNDEVNETIDIIYDLAELLSHLRGNVPTWRSQNSDASDFGYGVTLIEDPSRARRQLYNLARGHAILTGRTYVNKEDLPLVIKVTLSTAPIERIILLNFLLANNGEITVRDIIHGLNTSASSAKRTIIELKALELVDVIKEDHENPGERVRYQNVIKLKDKFSWFLTEQFRILRGKYMTGKTKEEVE